MDYADAGNTVIFNLSRGDQVYIQTRSNHHVGLFGAADRISTTFSGSLLALIVHGREDHSLMVSLVKASFQYLQIILLY